VEPEPVPASLAAELDRLTELIASFDADPYDGVRERVVELLRAVDRVHRPGLVRLAELLRAAGLEARALDDPEVRLLFDLYDLAEDGEVARTTAVLAGVVPYVESHGGQLEVLAAAGGVVRVRLSGACSGCQGSTATLRHVIEGALRAGLPEFVRLDVAEAAGGNGHVHRHGAPSAPGGRPGFVPLESVRPSRPPTLTWERAFDLADLPAGSVRAAGAGTEAAIVINLGGDVYAYRDGCPGTPLSLAGSRLEDGLVLVCPWHGCRFDARGGRRIDAEGPGLAVVPVAVGDGEVRLGRLAAVGT